MVADLASAAFREGDVQVQYRGESYTFPVLSASRWMEILSSPVWPSRVLLEADGPSYDRFMELAEDGVLDGQDMMRIACLVVDEQAGRAWWEGIKLAHVCLHNVRVLGTVLMRGARPETMTFAAFLAVVWAVLTQNASATDMMRYEAELAVPPPEAVVERGDDTDLSAVVQRLRGIPGVSIG